MQLLSIYDGLLGSVESNTKESRHLHELTAMSGPGAKDANETYFHSVHEYVARN